MLQERMSKRLFLLLACTFLFVSGVFAQTCADLRTLIDKNYGFKPSKLTSAEIDAKSVELDKVWSFVEKSPSTLLPCLRNEVAKRRTDTFFRFDASNLLIKHDKSAETKKLLIATYSEVDLADVARRVWLPPMTQLAREGHDISTAAEAWLRYPKPDYYLPRVHRPTLVTKDSGAIALFGSMDEALATPALVRLASTQNLDSRKIAYYMLIRQATYDAEGALRKLLPSAPQEYVEYIKKDMTPSFVEPRVGTPKMSRAGYLKALGELLDGKPDAWTSHTIEVPDGEKDMVAVLRKDDIPLVRKVRRYYAATPTELSVEWYELFTQIINTLRKNGSPKGAVRRNSRG